MIYLLKRCGHYIQIYKGFLSTCFTQAMSFRTHFVLLILVDSFFFVSGLLAVGIIYDHVATIGPWNRAQLMFFVTFMLLIHQIHMAVLSENFWEFSLILRTGELDFVLLKPAGSVFTVFFRRIRPGSFFVLIIAVFVLIYFGIQIQLTWSGWLLLPFFIVFSFVLTGILEMVVSCCMFWMLNGVSINFVRMEMQQLSRWPDFVYGRIIRSALTIFFPILLIGSAPIRFLIDSRDWLPILGMLGGIAVATAILKVLWRWGLQVYESASS